jgi:ribosomal protein S18 acetylase RimI-like enzyme
MEIKNKEMVTNFQIQRMSELLAADRAKMLDEVVRVEKETWPEEVQAPREKFEARAELFPEGFLLISTPDLGLVGVSTAEIINFDPSNPPHSWEDVTDWGWIRKTHSTDGNALYLVSVGASPRAKGLGVGTDLVRQQIEFARQRGLSYMVLGARIPGYAAYHQAHQEVTIEQYVALKREDEALIDPELRFYTRAGMRLDKVMPNYMEDDPESENYGAIMVWRNPSKKK